MKKILSLFVVLMLVFSVSILAHEEPAEPLAVDLVNPGMTPDSFLYFLDSAMESITLALTFNKDARVSKELAIAEEKLAEARAMALEGKMDEMSKAENQHGKVLAKLKEEVKDVEDGDSEGELKKELEIEKKIKQHSKKVKNVKQELKLKIKIKGELTIEQQNLLQSILTSLEGQTGEVEIEIKNEKGKTKIKINQETGDDGDEVEKTLKKEIDLEDADEDDLNDNDDGDLEDVDEDNLDDNNKEDKEEIKSDSNDKE